MTLHLGTQQRQQHDEMVGEEITIRQMVWYYFGRDIMLHPLPLGTLGMMSRAIPPHPVGTHNRRIGDHPFYFNSAGERPDHNGPYYPGRGKADGGIPDAGKGRDVLPKGEARGGKIGPAVMRGPPPKALPVQPVPEAMADPTPPVPTTTAPHPRDEPTVCIASDGSQVIFPSGFKPPPQSIVDSLVPVKRVGAKMKPAPSSKPSGPPIRPVVPIVLTEITRQGQMQKLAVPRYHMRQQSSSQRLWLRTIRRRISELGR
eukprot:4634510-Amphidinium_carterae.1